jgi:hypothetical protein
MPFRSDWAAIGSHVTQSFAQSSEWLVVLEGLKGDRLREQIRGPRMEHAAAQFTESNRTVRRDHLAEWPRGLAPRGPHRSGREPLDSSGSCHHLKAAAFRQDLSVPPVAG